MQKPSVIGTGLSGLVGSRIVELLARKWAFANLDLSTGVDITNDHAVKKAIQNSPGNTVLHCAAMTDVDAAHKEMGHKNGVCYRVNVLGTRHVARASARSGKYLIHISTDFVFAGEKKAPYTEADQPRPIEWYGQTKLWAEEEVQNAGGKFAILRIAFPFRAHFPPKLDLVRMIIAKLKNNTLYPMFFDQTITPTFIDDIARAVDTVLRIQPQGIYHIVGSTSLSPYTLAKKIVATFDFDPKRVKKSSLSEYLRTAKRPYQKHLALSNRKAQKELGVTLSTLDVALKKLKSQHPQARS